MKRTRNSPKLLAGFALMLAGEIYLACMGVLAFPSPAAAQFWDFPLWGGGRRQQGSQRGWSPWQGWQSGPEQRAQPVDASKAPPPRKQEGTPAKNVLVIGDSMADWLGFGLEDAFAEGGEFGVTRKFRTYSGLIRGESRKDYDWPQAAKEILAAEKPDVIVVMIGISDRQPIRERPPKANPKQPPQAATQTQSKLEGPRPTSISPQTTEPSEEAADAEKQKTAEETQSPAHKPGAAEPTGPMMTYEFRSEKWGEAYGRRIDEMIAVLKSKGAPVLWVGLPPLRAPRASADVAYLNELYRGHAEKEGITYVDVWDGFVDENGNFAARGPDFEGQIRVLRAGDGVHFSKAGARKLAHYVDREIHHAMLSRGVPMVPIPEEPQADAARPSSPAVRPVAGPVVPLTATPDGPETLLGTTAQRPGVADPNANRVLVKGEPLGSVTGRADDFAWPRPNANPEAQPEPTPAVLQPSKPTGSGSPSSVKAGTSGPPAATNAPAAIPAKKRGTDSLRQSISAGEEPARSEPARRRTPTPTSPDVPRPPAAVPLPFR